VRQRQDHRRAAFSRHLAASGRRVVAVDVDINQHLGAALGYGGAPPWALGADLGRLKEHLRGTNPRLPPADEMIKTTPPGRGSRLVDLGADDAVPFAELEADNRAVLADVRAALDGRERDWAAYHRTTVAMHRANATAWAGVDRIAQIDPDFVPD
jgi:hypothetical protein